MSQYSRRPRGRAGSAKPRFHVSHSQAAAPVAQTAAPVRREPPTEAETALIEASEFNALGLSSELVRAVVTEGYTTPSPVQREVIPHALRGKDVIACAQTGTGKTAAFVLPLLDLLAKEPPTGAIRALILTPTRELAAQIGERIGAYGAHTAQRHVVIYGGVSQFRQEEALRQRTDILVATPGRLLDLMQQGKIRLDGVQHYVLDEADRMLDMGFLRDVQRITNALPKVRHTLFFSATFPAAIEDLARRMLVDPVRVSIARETTTAAQVEHSVMFVTKDEKRVVLEKLLKEPEVSRAIVFSRTKHGANRLAEQLDRAGIVSAAIHGNKSQAARERALASFRAGTTRVLVATDLAARGIDVDGISHVVNYDLPNVAESYVHRIGRTGRAGASGIAISLCAHDERSLLHDIEKFIRAKIPTRSLAGVVTAAPPASADGVQGSPQGGSARVGEGPAPRTNPQFSDRSGRRFYSSRRR